MRDQMETGKRAGLPAGLIAPQIRACLAGTGRTALQNILMRMPDKVCAVGLAALAPQERQPYLALMAPVKAARVREEMRLEAMRRTTPLVRGRIVRTFLSFFGRARRAPGTIWIRPLRNR